MERLSDPARLPGLRPRGRLLGAPVPLGRLRGEPQRLLLLLPRGAVTHRGRTRPRRHRLPSVPPRTDGGPSGFTAAPRQQQRRNAGPWRDHRGLLPRMSSRKRAALAEPDGHTGPLRPRRRPGRRGVRVLPWRIVAWRSQRGVLHGVPRRRAALLRRGGN